MDYPKWHVVENWIGANKLNESRADRAEDDELKTDTLKDWMGSELAQNNNTLIAHPSYSSEIGLCSAY